MTLAQWHNNGWLRPHQTSKDEIGNLLAIADRDDQDARQAISPDWRFGIAYNAALKLCTILLYASGFRPEKALAHFRTLKAMPLVLGSNHEADAAYLDACRMKRNTVEYDYVGGATEADADELLEFVREMRESVMTWLKTKHPDLL